jgi:PAS domain S-box-containing protein
MMIAITEWLLAAAFGYITLDPANKIIWARIEYVGVTSVPLLVFVFAVNYSGLRPRLTGKRLILTALIPAVTLLFALTNDLHGLIWSSYVPYRENGLMLSHKVYGLWFWIYWAYSYLLLLAATFLIIRAILKSNKIFLGQAVVLTLGILLPWLGNAFYVLRRNPLGDLDLTPLLFAFTGVMLSLGIVRWHLFDIKPTAHIAVIENLADGMILLNEQNRVIDINPAARRIFKVGIRETIGKPGTQVLPGELFSGELKDVNGKSRQEIMMLDQNGERHYELTDTPFYHKGGDLIGRIVMVHDTTELKLVHERLRVAERQILEKKVSESEGKYRDLYENAPVAYFSVGNDGLINESNKAAQLLYGYSEEELFGKPRLDLYAPECIAKAVAIFDKLKKGLYIEDEETIYQRKNGGRIYALLSATPLLDEKGQVFAVRSVVKDITERKLAEAQKLEMETLKRTNQAKMELLANVSHELRTPLSSIKGFIETLIEPDIEWNKNQQLDFLMSANKEADRLTFLIRDLLDMSRLDSGKLKLDQRFYPVSEILDSVSGVLSIITEKHQLKITLGTDLPSIHVDKVRIGQVITNLVENATKFSPEGSLIQIEAKMEDGYLRISVTDAGIGMSPEVVANLFNRFYQAGEMVKGKTKGTGLGLSICKGIVEAHNGKIWAENRPGQGSKFTFNIPLNSP